MLTSCKLTGSPESVSAYHTAEENYYFAQADGGHVRVYGQLASRLGLEPGSAISQEAFTKLLAGRDARGTPVTRPHKVNGIDLTFSAPKSVSVAGLLSVRDPRIIEAHDKAVLDTMAEIERHCAGTQPRAGQHEKTGNVVYVAVRDGFNRDHDPHLHTHVVVANLTAYGDRVMALDGRQIMTRDFNKLWGAMYRAKLAANLNEFGYSVTYTKKGELRMDAVSLEAERAFSGRSREIKAKKEAGLHDMAAWRRSRKEKAPTTLKSLVQKDWRARLAACPEKAEWQNRADALAECEAWYRAARWSVEAKQQVLSTRPTNEATLWQYAARRATDRTACASAAALITEYLAELGRAEKRQALTYEDLKGRLDRQVHLGNLVLTKDGYYTTWEMIRADRECSAPYRGRPTPVMSEGIAEWVVQHASSRQ